jgi:hypothetical protein
VVWERWWWVRRQYLNQFLLLYWRQVGIITPHHLLYEAVTNDHILGSIRFETGYPIWEASAYCRWIWDLYLFLNIPNCRVVQAGGHALRCEWDVEKRPTEGEEDEANASQELHAAAAALITVNPMCVFTANLQTFRIQKTWGHSVFLLSSRNRKNCKP